MAVAEQLAPLDEALRGLRPTLPITLEDAAAVWERARPHVKRPLLLDIMHDGKMIFVTVFNARGERVWARGLVPV